MLIELFAIALLARFIFRRESAERPDSSISALRSVICHRRVSSTSPSSAIIDSTTDSLRAPDAGTCLQARSTAAGACMRLRGDEGAVDRGDVVEARDTSAHEEQVRALVGFQEQQDASRRLAVAAGAARTPGSTLERAGKL